MGEYRPSIFSVRTSLQSFRVIETSRADILPARPPRLNDKIYVFYLAWLVKSVHSLSILSWVRQDRKLGKILTRRVWYQRVKTQEGGEK